MSTLSLLWSLSCFGSFLTVWPLAATLSYLNGDVQKYQMKSSLTTVPFYLMAGSTKTWHVYEFHIKSACPIHHTHAVGYIGYSSIIPFRLLSLYNTQYGFYTQMSVRDLLGQETLQLLCQCTHRKFCQIRQLKANVINQRTWVLICIQKKCLGKNINETSILDVTKQHI